MTKVRLLLPGTVLEVLERVVVGLLGWSFGPPEDKSKRPCRLWFLRVELTPVVLGRGIDWLTVPGLSAVSNEVDGVLRLRIAADTTGSIPGTLNPAILTQRHWGASWVGVPASYSTDSVGSDFAAVKPVESC